MRFKDFDTKDAIIRLSDGLVSVSTTAYSDHFAVNQLKARNRNFLSRWETVDNPASTDTKIFTMFYKDKLVGQIVLYDFLGDESKKCSVSYWIDEFCTNRGITTTALKLVVSHAFVSFDVDSIEASIQQENIASIKVVEKIGFTKAGHVKKYMVMAQDKVEHDVYVLNK